jgi:hypothetical protein
VDERAFVEALMAAVPEAFEGPLARAHYLEGEPLTYPALGDACIWLEDHAIKIWLLGRGARVRSGREARARASSSPACGSDGRRRWSVVAERERDHDRHARGGQDAGYRGLAPCTSTACW